MEHLTSLLHNTNHNFMKEMSGAKRKSYTGAKRKSYTEAKRKSYTGAKRKSYTGAKRKSYTGAKRKSYTGAKRKSCTGAKRKSYAGAFKLKVIAFAEHSGSRVEKEYIRSKWEKNHSGQAWLAGRCHCPTLQYGSLLLPRRTDMTCPFSSAMLEMGPLFNA